MEALEAGRAGKPLVPGLMPVAGVEDVDPRAEKERCVASRRVAGVIVFLRLN